MPVITAAPQTEASPYDTWAAGRPPLHLTVLRLMDHQQSPAGPVHQHLAQDHGRPEIPESPEPKSRLVWSFMSDASGISSDRDEQVAIYLKKRLIGRGRCEIKGKATGSTDHAAIRLQYIQWVGGYEPPLRLLEQPYTLVFDDGTRITGLFDDVLSGARPSVWLRFTELPQT
ncbi:MAG: hypothetical protein HW416_1495 [Chloroflexi bacterium]|nr:hypothetical protein [Chloroflexota bacterium]